MTQSFQRSFRYRFYPTVDQAEHLSRTFGCVRLVYNMALEARVQARRYGRPMTYKKSSAMLTGWKRDRDLAFLNEVSCVPLQQALRHLQTAFGNHFAKRAGHPRFKSRKRSRASAEYTRSAFAYTEGQLTLAKMKEPLRIVWSRPLPDGVTPSTVTVSRDAAGRWFVCLLCQVPIRPMEPTERAVGLDAGITALVTTSAGEKVFNPRHERCDRQRLRKAQRALSRKQLEYKCSWYGRELVVIDRWFPSSKRCSACGAVQEAMPLGVRTWACLCGAVHDRDVNAARNILAVGLAER